jgi:hypothetical protein
MQLEGVCTLTKHNRQETGGQRPWFVLVTCVAEGRRAGTSRYLTGTVPAPPSYLIWRHLQRGQQRLRDQGQVSWAHLEYSLMNRSGIVIISHTASGGDLVPCRSLFSHPRPRKVPLSSTDGSIALLRPIIYIPILEFNKIIIKHYTLFNQELR